MPYNPLSLTEEQSLILESTARVTLAVAGPGSGKTRVFTSFMSKKIDEWPYSHAGIAALSFTNIAERTIRNRLDATISRPHFIGTIDSFLLKFVLRPFAHTLGLTSTSLRLIPEVIVQRLQEPNIQFNGSHKNRAPLFQLSSSKGDEIQPIFTHKAPNRPPVDLSPNDSKYALAEKKKIWNKSGAITHSDSHLIASQILNHPRYGSGIVNLIGRRFPTILVDELQDTGYFLTRALRTLFKSEDINIFAVGDPDQCIYGFAGASQTIFQDLIDTGECSKYPLLTTQRCSVAVSEVATALSSTGKTVVPKRDATPGNSAILVYDCDLDKLQDILYTKLQERWDAESKNAILFRNNKSLDEFNHRSLIEFPCKKSSGAKSLHRSVSYLRNGDPGAAKEVLSDLMGKILFADDAPHHITSNFLLENRIDLVAWKKAIFRVLKTASKVAAGETWNEWIIRCKESVRSALLQFDENENFKLGSIKRDTANGNRERIISDYGLFPPEQLLYDVRTVHGVKGDEYDNVCFIIPSQREGCPSAEWWEEALDKEERRIAFVATTRTKNEFILCMPSQTYENFKTLRSEFLALFKEQLIIS